MDFKIMKKIVFGFLMTMGMLNAQNNLVYNQTINLELNPAQEVVVPEGKTWKIEFINVEDPNGVNSFDIGILNSSGQYNIHTIYTAANTIADAHLIWLKEGSKIIAVGDAVFVSALEFTIVPTSTGTGSGSVGGGVSSDGLVFEEAMSITLTRTQDLNSSTSLFGEITVPEGKILKVFNVSTYALSTVTGSTQSEGNGFVFIGDELFYPSLSNNNALIRFLPSGTHTVKMDWSSTGQPNRIVVNALLYSTP